MAEQLINKTLTIQDFVLANSIRGECVCGLCKDANAHPEDNQPSGHTVDVIFFKVALKEWVNIKDLSSQLKEVVKHHRGVFNEIDFYDTKDHSYIEIGGWIGDQGLALQFMGLCELLGVAKVITPRTIFKDQIDEDTVKQMAGQGFITLYFNP